MPEPAPLTPDVFNTSEGISNPYPGYLAFRGPGPVRYLRLPPGPMSGRTEPLYAWMLLRHADVMAAVRDPATFSSDSPTWGSGLAPTSASALPWRGWRRASRSMRSWTVSPR